MDRLLILAVQSDPRMHWLYLGAILIGLAPFIGLVIYFRKAGNSQKRPKPGRPV